MSTKVTPRKAATCRNCKGNIAVVRDACFEHSCWCGQFMCQDAKANS